MLHKVKCTTGARSQPHHSFEPREQWTHSSAPASVATWCCPKSLDNVLWRSKPVSYASHLAPVRGGALDLHRDTCC
jgi:hypothetical protein